MRERSPLNTRARPVKTPSLHASFDAGDLEDRTALGGQVAPEQTEAAGVLEGLVDPVDDLLVGSGRGEPPDLLGQGLARAGQRVTVEEAGLEELARR